MNIAEMTNRELGRALMIGDRQELKRGYTAANAIHAVEMRNGRHGIEPWRMTQEDQEYLIGFGDGMKNKGRDPSIAATSTTYDEGYQSGTVLLTMGGILPG